MVQGRGNSQQHRGELGRQTQQRLFLLLSMALTRLYSGNMSLFLTPASGDATALITDVRPTMRSLSCLDHYVKITVWQPCEMDI